MDEQGVLRAQLQNCEERPEEDCRSCGGEGFILCTWCQGVWGGWKCCAISKYCVTIWPCFDTIY